MPQKNGNRTECTRSCLFVCLFVYTCCRTWSYSRFLCFYAAAIRFGRMPQAEKMKLKEESKMVEKHVESPMKDDHKILVKHIHEAYIKNFTMNKAKARLVLTGKTSKPVS